MTIFQRPCAVTELLIGTGSSKTLSEKNSSSARYIWACGWLLLEEDEAALIASLRLFSKWNETKEALKTNAKFYSFLFSYGAIKEFLWMYTSPMELPTSEFLSARKSSCCKFIHVFLADAGGLAKIRWQITVVEIDLPHIPINNANTSVPKLSNIQSFWENGKEKKA